MDYVVTGYVISGLVLAGYAASLVWRRRRLERAAATARRSRPAP